MANTYQWVISELEVYPELDGKQNVVKVVHWKRQTADNTASVYGDQHIKFDSTATFTPFNQLQPQTIVKWLEETLGADKISLLDANLDKQVDSAGTTNPVLPWA